MTGDVSVPLSASGDEQPMGPILSMPEALRRVAHVDGKQTLILWPRQRADNDALSDPYWSVVETVAWVATGDIAIVSGVMDAVEYGKTKNMDPWIYAEAYLRSDVENHHCHCGGKPCICTNLARAKVEKAAERGELSVTGNALVSGAR